MLHLLAAGAALVTYQGFQADKVDPQIAKLGKVRVSAAENVATVNRGLSNAAGLAKAISWTPLTTLSPGRTSSAGNYLSFYRTAYVDGNGVGIADVLGMPGGWHSEPGDDQSYLGVWMNIPGTAKRYGLSYEIWRYEEDSGPAQFQLKVAGKTILRNLTGSGTIHFSFTPSQAGLYMAELRMMSKGRYLFRKVDLKTSVL